MTTRRVTLTLPDELLLRLKTLAAACGVTLSQLVTGALVDLLTDEAPAVGAEGEGGNHARAQPRSLARMNAAGPLHFTIPETRARLTPKAPRVRRLSGSLSPRVTPDDYRRYLEDKYGAHDADPPT